MSQEPSSRELLEAVKQQESGGRRYKADGKTLLEGPPTKYGTAKGEMQVLDMTNRDPGFGVRPAKDDSPDERARVGRDYLAAMKKRYGDTETGLIAYNWGPGNTDKWIKKGADPAKLPKETQNYVAKITASLGGTKVAGTKAAPVKAAPTKVAETKVDISPRRTGAALLQNPLFSQLGPSYQAAMAVSMLADEAEKEDKDEDAPSESEKMLAAMPSTPAPVVELDLGYQSPFPEIQAQAEPAKPRFLPMLRPVRMAEGGEATKKEGRTEDSEVGYSQDFFGVPDSGPVTSDTLSKEPISFLDKYRMFSWLEKNHPEMMTYNNNEPAVFLSIVRGQSTFSDTDPQEQLLERRTVNPFANRDFFQKQPSEPIFPQRREMSRPENFDYPRLESGDDPVLARKEREKLLGQRNLGTFYAEGGDVTRLTPQQIERIAAQEAAQRQASSTDAFIAQRSGGYFQDPFGVPDSGPVTSDTLSKGKEFSAADALKALKETGTGVARNVKNIAKGTTETPYNLVGSVADIGNMVLTPFGLGSAEPTLGSAQLKRLATEAGIRPAPPTDPRDAGFYMMGELGSSVLNPSGVVRSGVKAAEKTVTKGKKAAQMLAKDFQAYNQALGPAGVAYAAKPQGGTFGYTPEDLERAKPITYLAKLIRDYRTEASDLGAGDEILEFLKTKAPKYFTTMYGTANDPLRTGIRNRRIDPFGADVEQLPPYLVDAAIDPAARGNLQAKKVLEKAYDDMTGIRAYSLRPEDADGYMFRRNIEQGISEKMGQEGVPVEARNLPIINAFSTVDFEQYPSSSELLRRLYNQEAMPPNIQQALRTSEPIYDIDPRLALLKPENVIEALQQVPVNKLKTMSFPEALIQGTQALAPVRDYLAAVALAEKGAKVPRKALDMFTTSVMKAPSFNGQWVTLDKSVATRLEGKLMKHSIGDYNFGSSYGTAHTDLPYGGKKAFDEGLVRVYSLRDDQGLPKVTLEMAKSEGGKGSTWNVSQIKGRFNSEPLPETREDIFRLLDKVNGQEGLSKIKTNSYSMSPTGERSDTKRVDWSKEYDLWTSEQQRAAGGMVQGYAEGGIADLPKGYDEEDPTTLKPFLPTTTSTANNAGIATIVPGYGNPNAAAITAAAFDSMTPAQKVVHQKILEAINDARPMAFTIAEAIKNQFFPVTSTGGIGDGGDGPVGTVTVGPLGLAPGDGAAPGGVGNGGGSVGGNAGIGNGATASGVGTGIGSGASSGAGLANGGMIERQFTDNRRYM